MIEMANHPVQSKLPREILAELDPKLVKLYAQLSPALRSRIGDLVRRALLLGMDSNRLVKYAFLYATAEVQARGDEVSKDHAARSRLELAGEIHGLPTGYRDHAEAKRRYHGGRRARQQIKASLDAVLGKWRLFEQVVQKHRSELPVHLQSRFSNTILGEVRKILRNMGIAAVLDEEDLIRERGRERELSATAQTYIWWRFAMAPYRGKWNDMHQLAFTWRMSPTASIKRFRTVVGRICKGATCSYPFGKSWESVLSEE
jgi:hypothetical protein